MDTESPTIHRRRLGRALRELRLRASLTGSEAGNFLERSGSWVSRVEGGRVGLRVRDLRDLLDLYGVQDVRRREELEALARGGRQRAWWSRYSEQLPESLVILIGLEDAARTILGYQQALIPGLLQTERYSRAALQQGAPVEGPLSQAEIESRVQVQMARQANLRREPPPQLHLLLDEAVLYRTIGGNATLKEQLEHLLTAAQEPWIDLRAIPFTHGDRIVPTSTFSLLSFPHDPDIIWLDNSVGQTYVDDDEAVRAYNRIFEQMMAAALGPEETNGLIEKAIGRLT